MVLGGVTVTALWYATGVRALRHHGAASRRAVAGRHVVAFSAGLTAVAVALVSPLDPMAEWSLSAHMLQHLLLILVAAPLLVVGRPMVPFSVVLPATWRRGLKRLGHRPWVATAGRTLTLPVVAWLVHVTVVWAWHAPGPYDAAAGDPWIHLLEHASFLGTGILFWWVAFQPGPRRRLARGADVLFVLMAWLATGALGALFVFATTPLYPFYVGAAAAHGVDPLRDQQVAGLIMWIPAGMVYLGAAGAFFVGWLRNMELEMRRAEATEAARLPVAR
jgi:cytochrome c oxidase assembly factor CtaG